MPQKAAEVIATLVKVWKEEKVSFTLRSSFPVLGTLTTNHRTFDFASLGCQRGRGAEGRR